MKNVFILAFVFGFLFSTSAFAQNIENVKKETTVKKVTVKDTDVQTVIEKDVKEEVSVVKVEGTDKVNQKSEDVVVKEVKTQTVDVVTEGTNKENKEYERVDGQQRGAPVQTGDEVPTKPLKQDQKKKGDG